MQIFYVETIFNTNYKNTKVVQLRFVEATVLIFFNLIFLNSYFKFIKKLSILLQTIAKKVIFRQTFPSQAFILMIARNQLKVSSEN